MQIVSPGAEGHINNGWAATVSGGSGASLDFEFLNGIHGWIKDQDVGIGIDAQNTVEYVNPDIRRIPIDYSSARSPTRCVSSVGDIGGAAVVVHTRSKLYQLSKVAIVEWQVHHLLPGTEV